MQTATALSVFEQTLRALEEAAFARGHAAGKAEGRLEGGGLRAMTAAEVCGALRIGETSLRSLRAEDPTFPKPKLLGTKRIMRWLERDLDTWVIAQ